MSCYYNGFRQVSANLLLRRIKEIAEDVCHGLGQNCVFEGRATTRSSPMLPCEVPPFVEDDGLAVELNITIKIK